MARIVTVYNNPRAQFSPVEMGVIRWHKVSEALAKLGHQVDMAANDVSLTRRWRRKPANVSMGRNLRRIPLSSVDWQEYDVVKTFYHVGFDTLERFGGADHPFIISHLGSVVGPEDAEGVYFYGDVREALYATQERVNKASKYLTFVSEPAVELWSSCFGSSERLLVVPAGGEADIPAPRKDPFPREFDRRCIFAGNIYLRNTQPEANSVLTAKLNALGAHLSELGIRLFMFGFGDTSGIDQEHVSYLGAIPYDETWDYFHFAQVGCVVAYGPWLHNNESTKIYYYLRAGLPVVSEEGFPNDHIVGESGLGFTVENGDMKLLAQKVSEATHRDWDWDRDRAVRYILENHTWDKRVQAHDRLIRQELGQPA